jgi:hypothetical protein
VDNNTMEAVKAAFKQGYMQGNEDGKEGVFIEFSSILDHFVDSMNSRNISTFQIKNIRYGEDS